MRTPYDQSLLKQTYHTTTSVTVVSEYRLRHQNVVIDSSSVPRVAIFLSTGIRCAIYWLAREILIAGTCKTIRKDSKQMLKETVH